MQTNNITQAQAAAERAAKVADRTAEAARLALRQAAELVAQAQWSAQIAASRLARSVAEAGPAPACASAGRLEDCRRADVAVQRWLAAGIGCRKALEHIESVQKLEGL